MRFLPRLLLLAWLPACWVSCHFHCTGFSSHSASTLGAYIKLGFCCAWPLSPGGWAEVVSARLNLSHGTIEVRGVCNFLGSVSLQQKLEGVDRPVLQPHVTTQLYEESKGKDIR